MSDTQGNVFYYGNENLRKLAVKRIKNNKGKIKFLAKNNYDDKNQVFNFYNQNF